MRKPSIREDNTPRLHIWQLGWSKLEPCTLTYKFMHSSPSHDASLWSFKNTEKESMRAQILFLNSITLYPVFLPGESHGQSSLAGWSPRDWSDWSPKHIPYKRYRCFPSGTDDKQSACQCRRHRRHGFNLWVGEIPCRRKWQPTPVFLAGKFHGPRSPMGYSPLGHKELDTTKQLNTHTKKGPRSLEYCLSPRQD